MLSGSVFLSTILSPSVSLIFLYPLLLLSSSLIIATLYSQGCVVPVQLEGFLPLGSSFLIFMMIEDLWGLLALFRLVIHH